VQPEPPAFLQPYQPHLRYYLIDEGAYSGEGNWSSVIVL